MGWDVELVAIRVQRRREAAGLTQAEVCRSLGVSRPTYIRSEQGLRPFSASEVAALAGLLKCDVSDLVGSGERVWDEPNPVLAMAAVCRWVHLLDAGEITEGRFAKFVGCDRVSSREVAQMVRLAAEMTLVRRGLVAPERDTLTAGAT